MDSPWFNKEHIEALFKNTTQAITKSIFGPVPATVDQKINDKNKDTAISDKNIQYGLADGKDESYWKSLAIFRETTPEDAKKSQCSNCSEFDTSDRMKKLLSDNPSENGYCWKNDFKCQSSSTCYAWKSGKPIVTDARSYNRHEKADWFAGPKIK